MKKTANSMEDLTGAELVTLVRPGAETDIVYLSAFGPVSFREGRAIVPLAIAREMAGPGWSIEPQVKLRTNERNEA